jgi:hypothetical protein
MSAEAAIVELRSFESTAPPHFQPALCDTCEQSINERRVQPVERMAA